MASTPRDFILSHFYYSHSMTLLGLLAAHLHFMSFDYLIIQESPLFPRVLFNSIEPDNRRMYFYSI